jgi:hypothetical protein
MATYLLRADDADMARWKAGRVRGEAVLADLAGLPEMWLNDLPDGLERARSAGGSSLRGRMSGAGRRGGCFDRRGSPVDTGSGADRPPVPQAPPVDLRQQARELAAAAERMK